MTTEQLPTRIAQLLQQHQTRFQVSVDPDVPGHYLTGLTGGDGNESRRVRTVALGDTEGVVVALLPAGNILDLAALCEALNRNLSPLPEDRFRETFPDCDSGCCPPLGLAYGADTVVDVGLYTRLVLNFEAGRRGALLRMETRDFQRIAHKVALGRFAIPTEQAPMRLHSVREDLSEEPDLTHLFPDRATRAAERCHGLPPLPQTAALLLQLASDPHSGVEQLAAIIERDAPIAARVLSLANSSLYGFSGRIADLDSAIARVLGFDTALGIAIDMSLRDTLRVSEEGPLGLNAYRRDSIYCANLAKMLARHIPAQLGIIPGVAYMAGLLHSIGILFLGHSFPEQHRTLSLAMQVNPQVPLTTLEHALLATDHLILGEKLLDAWDLPAEIITSVRHHHDESYQGIHAGYARLIGLTTQLLHRHGVSERNTEAGMASAAMKHLELSESQVCEAIDRLFGQREKLDGLVQLVA